MTTIVYRDGILAADSLATSIGSSECSKCGHSTDKVTAKDREKIKVGFDASFRNERILAVAAAGSSRQTNKAVELLRSGEDIVSMYEAIFKVLDSASLSSFGILIVTEKSVWILDVIVSRKEVMLRHFDKKAKVALGSGETTAEFAMEVLGWGAVDAVKASVCSDHSSGGRFISWVECGKQKLLDADISKEILPSKELVVKDLKTRLVSPRFSRRARTE